MDRSIDETAGGLPASNDGAELGDDGGSPQAGVDFSNTNVQEAGIDEPDQIKTDGERILAIAGNSLHLIDASGMTAELRGSLELPAGSYGSQMFLFRDRVLVIAHTDMQEVELSERPSQWETGYEALTQLVEVDISQPDDLKIVSIETLGGRSVAARMIDGVVRVVLHSEPNGLDLVSWQSIYEGVDRGSSGSDPDPAPLPEPQPEPQPETAELPPLAASLPAYRGPEDDRALSGIESAVLDTVHAGAVPVVVFDLDHTLFDNRPRTQQILHAFAATLGPEQHGQAERLRGLPATAIHYMLGDTFTRAGIDATLLEPAITYWAPRFFADDYALLDVPYTEAPAYVSALYEHGATIVYLTGRDAPRMLVGTRESLRRWEFPISEHAGEPEAGGRTRLILKPSKDEDDLEFKRRAFETIDGLGAVVGVFENEPGNLAAMAERWPEATPVFLMTDFNPKRALPLPEGAKRVSDYGTR